LKGLAWHQGAVRRIEAARAVERGEVVVAAPWRSPHRSAARSADQRLIIPVAALRLEIHAIF
jgi:hypothetical protein